MSGRLDHRPISFREACAFVTLRHRHHRAPVGHKFSLAAYEGERLCGIAIIGRPVARMIDHTTTLEITRLCTDGTKDAPSFLLGRCRAAVFALGYLRLITYTLPSEGGASLRGAGYTLVGERGGGKWSRADRERLDDHPTEAKLLWEVAA